MAITLDGTNGITTPDVDTDGLTVDTNTLFVDAANNRVGVGTSSPAFPLSISKLGETFVGNYKSIADFRETSAAVKGISLGYDDTSQTAAFISTTASAGSQFAFVTFNGSAWGERARIDASGNLLVGGTTAGGQGTLSVLTPASGNLGTGQIIFNRAASTETSFCLLFGNNSSFVGSITHNNTSTSFNTSSDYRLKENVVPLAGAADRLAQIPVHRFNFIADPDTTVDGFLAHEVQEFVPECVTGQKDEVDDEGKPVYQGIDQSKLTPLLTAALQEALQKIDNLTARISALETSA